MMWKIWSKIGQFYKKLIDAGQCYADKIDSNCTWVPKTDGLLTSIPCCPALNIAEQNHHNFSLNLKLYSESQVMILTSMIFEKKEIIKKVNVLQIKYCISLINILI